MFFFLSALLTSAVAADPPPSTVEAMAKLVAFDLQATVPPNIRGDTLEYRRSPIPCPEVGGAANEILLSIDRDGRRTLVVFVTMSIPAGSHGSFGVTTFAIVDRDVDGFVDPDDGCGCGVGALTQIKLYANALTCALKPH